MNIKLSFLAGTLLLYYFIPGRAPGQVGIGTSSPSPAAALEISSTSKGLLIPRMTATQRLSIVLPATGLLVYQTDEINKGFYYNSGTPGLAAWTYLQPA